MKFKSSILLLSVLSMFACHDSPRESGQASVSENYEEEIQEWNAERIETLKDPTGWLRLAGMYILEEGENTFGSGVNQDLQFPEGTIPEHAGTFILNDGNVYMKAANGVDFSIEEEIVREITIYNGHDTPEIQYETLEWHVIKRQDLIAIRLYNKENKKADQFEGFDRYPVDSEWHLKARFIPNPENATIPITNVLGQTDEVKNPGTLIFEKDEKTFTLNALDIDNDRLFLIVGDQTNVTETYQAGRFIYVDYPDEDGYTIIDFNKIYNPPCAYNLFTTCQLPPPSNRLELAITAGELRPTGWEGL